MTIKVTEDQIYEIENQKVFGEYLVRRINMSELEVVKNGTIVFKGEDFEVAEYFSFQNEV
ncbi:hypothetical protein P9173_09370 [Bacillus safensis]|uniref:hypothetical protein n=1 Tax=Bacillus TaxID=1386 RepID=UPI0022819E3D|nr:hypothetical protein [Bacillus safensis]MCY7542489.1 hypothetical protein [Bacillus safensis]MCY7552364.1 hypothetical protein [Bacillus safensis]MCY7644795.1 hypothetical protein [Bacillus safensis]MCY7655890.1 hypothetical protein [Bacillus safensis]MEC3710364.1 hypothetical protein [Bacillus safensis]